MLFHTFLLLFLVHLSFGDDVASTLLETDETHDDSMTNVPISFGIRSFTVEVTTPTQKPKTNSSSFSTSKSVENLTSTIQQSDKIEIGEDVTEFQPNFSTESSHATFMTTEHSNITQQYTSPGSLLTSSSVSRKDHIENVFSEADLEQESTDERPPISSLSSSTQPIIGTTVNLAKNDNSFPTTTQEIMINDIHVEKKLDNGLYRIKLAEIITDEFGSNQMDTNREDHHEEKHITSQQHSTGGKINIIDLYPSKLEDFSPIIKDSNDKIIRNKQVFLNDDKNMLSNSLNQLFEEDVNIPTSKIEIELIDESTNTQRNYDDLDKVTDFTGKLQEKDGVITDIEKKFMLDDLKPSTAKPITVNHKIEFIDRRVKKSYDPPFNKFPRYENLGRVDIGNTKFNTDLTATVKTERDLRNLHSDKPEFSTTKFYNSKELYNEMLHKKLTPEGLESLSPTIRPEFLDIHSSQPINEQFQTSSATITSNIVQSTKDVSSLITQANLSNNEQTSISSPNFIEENSNRRSYDHLDGTQSTPVAARIKLLPNDKMSKVTIQLETKTTQPSTIKPLGKFKTATLIKPRRKLPTKPKILSMSSSSSVIMATRTPSTEKIVSNISLKISEIQKLTTTGTTTINPNTEESSGAGVLSSSSSSSLQFTLQTISSPGVSTTVTLNPLNEDNMTSTIQHSVTKASTTIVSTSPSSSFSPSPASAAATPSSTIRKPFSRPRVLTRLQEKINSLECDIQNVPQDSHLWRGNETHELLLPITTPEDCKTTEDCLPMIISWEGQAEIQSGDVLLVEINDALLNPADFNQTHNNAHKATTVYQVTRPGHEHCDVTEGVLLDITPLVVDGKKLVTLYDKDLTEGINLLIVVSELWGSQCVRLKVTVKSDNCGENADCSGKGVCFSNSSMEGYECQCCGGFAGPHCEEIDACSPSPCTNNGICVDLSQGHEGNAYQCLCPYGYTGKNCQYESDPCNPTECMNGGSCVGNSTHFRCDCAPGYTGPLCQHNLNECESSPCVHGICVDQEDGFRCFCQPGFAGELCNFEYNECESNPCLNGGQCNDQIGGYECKCTRGYTGKRCHVKIDFCANGPCPEGHRCIDRGDDFTCECPGGRNGPDCNQVPRTLCNVNPCANGGTCWTSEESFYCACRPGYTGKMCEDEFVVETVVSSSEFMVDDTSARSGFNDKGFGVTVSKSPIELHNAYIAAGTLAAAIFIVAIVVTICHCKVHQTYRRFSTKHHQLIPIFGFGRRTKSPKSHRHWLSGKGGGGGGGGGGISGSNGNLIGIKTNKNHLPGTGGNQCHNHHIGGGTSSFHPHQVHDRPFQRHLAMNLENDMYYTVDFSDSQHSPLIQ